MTNEEAIKRLERFKEQALNEFVGEPEDYPALDMAIEALKGQGDRCITTSLRLWADKATENGLIDRKRILQSITDYCELHGVSVETWIVRLITEEPQVEALEGQKTGKWMPMIRRAATPMDIISSEGENRPSSTPGIVSNRIRPAVMMQTAIVMVSLMVFFTRSGLAAPKL